MRSPPGLLSTLLVVVVSAAAPACGPPPPPSVHLPPPPAEPEPAPRTVAREPEADKGSSWLYGAWAWNDDVKELHRDGTGAYHRDGELCYEFTFTIEGDLLHTRADRDHRCGAKRENDWHVHLDQDEMVMRHAGSGYRTRWKRVKGPRKRVDVEE